MKPEYPVKTDKLFHIVVYLVRFARSGFELTTLGTDYIRICKSNYHMITARCHPKLSLYCTTYAISYKRRITFINYIQNRKTGRPTVMCISVLYRSCFHFYFRMIKNSVGEVMVSLLGVDDL